LHPQIQNKIRDKIFELSFILLLGVKDAALISGGCFISDPDKHDVCFKNALGMIFDNALVKRP
jgi:hypothetical protein